MEDHIKSLAIGVQVHADADTRIAVNPSPLDAERATLTLRSPLQYTHASVHIDRDTARRIVAALNGWLA